MKNKNKLPAGFLFLFSIILAGCASQPTQQPRAMSQPEKFHADSYDPKVDHFIILFDDSSSMGEYEWQGATAQANKLEIAKDIVFRMNRTIPELDYTSVVRTFGQGECLPSEITSIIYGPSKFSRAELEKAVKEVDCVGGKTPLDSAIDASTLDLKSFPGSVAVIVVTDGMVESEPVLRAAGRLKSQLGDRVCLYTVLVGADSEGRGAVESLAQVGQCGYSTTAEGLASDAQMSDFVEDVFLIKKVAMPAPPPPPVDSDGDGVTDDLDKCPNTPKGVEVDPTGCWIAKDLKFDFDKADIKPEYHEILDKAVLVLEMNPDLLIEIHGHTDSIGPDAYNQKLSERRAEAVKEYLVSRGIAGERLTAVGMGKMDPIASNDTVEGRMQNRRVEFNVANQNK